MNAILYGRFSTDKQDMQRQDHLLDIYCTRHSLTIIARLYDPDVSGSVPMAEREGGGQLLRLLAENRGQPLAIVTTEQDRIGRDTLDQIKTIRSFWDSGATPHFAAEGGAIVRTPENEMLMEFGASRAQYERNKIRQRITSKMQAKRANNELCGTVPYGFDAVETGATTAKGKPVFRLVDNPAEQKWILHMHSLRAAGWGYHSIAKDLNHRNVPTKHGKGDIMTLRSRPSNLDSRPSSRRFTTGRWQAGNVAKVLNNKTVSAWLSSRNAKHRSAVAVAA